MTLTQRTLETLIDLVENKLSCLEVFDREDAREQSNLEHTLNELHSLVGTRDGTGAPVLDFPKRGRGRPRAAQA